MTGLTRTQLLELYGGAADPCSLPAVIPPDLFLEIKSTTAFLNFVFNRHLEIRSRRQVVSVLITKSGSLSCTARKVDEREYLIFLPLGFCARMRVFARALLQFWFQSEHIVLINSPLDPVADTAWAIPPKLIPLFGPDQGVNEHSYWAALAELDKELTLSELFEQDVRELLHLVEVYALCHEFAHILERHFDLLENPSVLDFAATSHLTRTQLRRGLELHADVVASAFSPTILVEQIRQAYGRWSAMAARRRGFLRLSYGVTMLYAIFDAHRKYLLSYDQDAYTHPIIRRELFKDASTNTIRMNEGFVTRFFWTAAEVEGWVRCVHALADLDVRSLLGDYGELDHKNGTLRGTIHSLNYGASIAFSEAIASMIQEAYSLVRKVEGLLTAFCRPDSSKNTTQSSFRRDLIGDLTWTDLLPETGDPDLEDSDEHSRLALKLMMRFRAALWG